MRYLPINLDIRGKSVVIIGGGPVAERKCLPCFDAGARVKIVSPVLTDSLRALSQEGKIECLSREYKNGDLEGAFLVFAATNDSAVNRRVAEEAKDRGVMADVTDHPELGGFASPAVMRRGDLLIAVSTGGEAPLLAGKIREELADRYGPEYGELTLLMGRVREKLLTEKADSQYNKQILLNLLHQDLLSSIRSGADAEIDRILGEVCGPGFSQIELGIGKKDT